MLSPGSSDFKTLLINWMLIVERAKVISSPWVDVSQKYDSVLIRKYIWLPNFLLPFHFHFTFLFNSFSLKLEIERCYSCTTMIEAPCLRYNWNLQLSQCIKIDHSWLHRTFQPIFTICFWETILILARILPGTENYRRSSESCTELQLSLIMKKFFSIE